MKFKIVIALLFIASLRGGTSTPKRILLDTVAYHKPYAGNSPIGAKSARPKELEKWMYYQNHRKNLQSLNFDSVSNTIKNLLIAHDYRPNSNKSTQEKLHKSILARRKLNDIGQSVFGKTREQLEDDLERQNIEIVEEQKRLLLIQFYEVIREIQEPQDKDKEEVGSPVVAKLMTSYLQHLEYIYEKETKFGEAVPPVVYNYKIDQNIGAYCDSPSLELPPEAFLREDEDSIVSLFDEYNANKLGLINDPEQPNSDQEQERKSRKLFFRGFGSQNQRQQHQQQHGFQQPQSITFIKTEIYTKGSTDIPIEDSPDVYRKDWHLDAESLKNLHDMIELISKEYDKIFAPAVRLDIKLKSAVYEQDAQLTIEDYDEIKEMAKTVVNKGNQYKAIANQIIVAFDNRNPDLQYFLRLYKMDSMANQINSFRSQAGVGRIGEDYRADQVVDELREAYFRSITTAKDAERIFDNFAYQTQLMRTARDSSSLNPVKQLGEVSALRTIIPMLVRFQRSFEMNMKELMSDLNKLAQGDALLFDPADRLETQLNQLAEHRRRSWWHRW